MDWVRRIRKPQKQRQNKKQEEREGAGIGLKKIDKRRTNQEMLSLQKEQQNQIESGKSTSMRERKNIYIYKYIKKYQTCISNLSYTKAADKQK